MKHICLAGDGWGAVSALLSLQAIYAKLSVVSNDSDVLSLIRKEDVVIGDFSEASFDLVICAGYKPFVKKEVLGKQKVINIHYSLLPQYRGMHSTVWAIINGESRLGLTIHEMNEFMDDGDIVKQHEIKYVRQTSCDIMDACNVFIQNNLGNIVEDYLQDKIMVKPQNKKDATWVCKRNLKDCVVDFNQSVESTDNLFRALVAPYPLPMLEVKSDLYEITEHSLFERNYMMTNGRVVNIDAEGAWIKISDGLLVVKTLRLFQGDVDTAAQELLKIGMRLG